MTDPTTPSGSWKDTARLQQAFSPDNQFEEMVRQHQSTLAFQNTVSELTNQAVERHEAIHREAIRNTDWSETAVLRVIEYHPEPEPMDWDESGAYTVRDSSFSVERYAERAPPISEHADGKHTMSVRTLTKPLLDRLEREHPDIMQEVLE